MSVIAEQEEDEEPLDEVDNFRGLYVRQLSNTRFVERISFDAPIQSGTPIFGTKTSIVIVCPDCLKIVPRRIGHFEMITLPGAFVIDPMHGRAARIIGDGQMIEIFSLRDN